MTFKELREILPTYRKVDILLIKGVGEMERIPNFLNFTQMDTYDKCEVVMVDFNKETDKPSVTLVAAKE